MEPILPTRPRWLCLAVALIIVAIAGVSAHGQNAATTEPDKQLVFIEEHFDASAGGEVPNLQAPYDVKVAPDGKHVYVASQADNAVSFFARDSAAGTLTYIGDVDDVALGSNALKGARSIAVSPDGSYIYVASMFAGTTATLGGNLSTFSRDASTGELTFLGAIYDTDAGVDGLNGARTVAISPMPFPFLSPS